MKYLRYFEISWMEKGGNTIKPKFKEGDIVVCTNGWYDILELGGIYCINRIDYESFGIFIILDDDDEAHEWKEDRFRLATGEECKRYEIERDSRRYNI